MNENLNGKKAVELSADELEGVSGGYGRDGYLYSEDGTRYTIRSVSNSSVCPGGPFFKCSSCGGEKAHNPDRCAFVDSRAGEQRCIYCVNFERTSEDGGICLSLLKKA